MPYINSASIQSGQIIQANHVLNIINTFNDTANTDIKVKGTASFNEVEIKNLKVFGTASIDTFITTYYSSSVLYASGSTKFGDSADDTHQYTGSLGVSGSLRVNGTTQLGILGVNTKSPLVLNPDTSGGSVYYVKNDGAFVIGTGGDPYSGGVDAVAVNGFGNVSIGKTVPTSKLDVLGNVAVTGSVNVTGNITAGGLIGTASHALSSSFAVTASYALNGGSGTTFTGSFATTGSNTFIGNQVVSGSVNITGSLTVSGSSTFTNIGPTILRGTLAVVGEDGNTFLSASRTISSSLSSSINVDTATFNGTGFIILDPEDGTGAYRWNSNFDVYYSGTSGSGAYETELSPAFNAVSDNRNYDTFTIGFDNGISLVSGSVEAYNLYVNDLTKENWYKLEGLNPAGFTNGTPVRLSGASISDDLQSAGFTKILTDPTSNVNTIIYRQSYTFFTTQSALVLDSPRIYPTSSGTPTTTGSDGQFLFGTDGGKHYIYVWMNGGWRSGSLV